MDVAPSHSEVVPSGKNAIRRALHFVGHHRLIALTATSERKCQKTEKAGSQNELQQCAPLLPVVGHPARATPTIAARSRRSLIMYPACISCTIVPGS